MIKKVLVSISLMLCAALGFAEESPFSDELAFVGGERAYYNIYYNLGPIWIHAGDVEFTVKERKINKVEMYDFQLAGSSTKSFDKFYCIRDTFFATATKKDLLPYLYREVKHEDSYFCDKRYNFEWKGDKATLYTKFQRKKKLSYDTLSLEKGVLDLLTTCYHFRSVDISKVKKGQYIPFQLVYDNEFYNLKVKYSGTENVKLKNKKKYKALKFTPQMITGDIFEDEDAMSIYVSNDENHVPLYIEAKIKVGYVKVMLSEVSNTKTPMSSVTK